MQEKVKVLVADDNGMTREMMHQGLGRMEEVQVVGLAANGRRQWKCCANSSRISWCWIW